MKITTEIMILKVGEIKQSKNGEPYFMLDFSDMDGDVFSIMIKDIQKIKDYEPFTRHTIDLKISSSKYGIQIKAI